MNAAQIHLAMLHFPIAGVFLGVGFLGWGLIRASSGARKAGLALFFISGLTVLPVFFSGEGAEEIVEGKPLVTESIIETHEEAAELAFYATLILAGFSLAALVGEKKQLKISRMISSSVLIIGIVSAVLLARAAHLGGMIRHDELRSGAIPPASDGDREENENDD